MRKRLLFGSGLVVTAILFSLLVWQSSFSLEQYGPSSPAQVPIFWGISTLVFLLTVTVGFMLFRTGAKLYLERRSNREGSRIKTKLVLGALGLSFLPVVFLVLWSYTILNYNLQRWFSRPAEGIRLNMVDVAHAIEGETRAKTRALARWMATLTPGANLAAICREHDIEEASLLARGGQRAVLCSSPAKAGDQRVVITERVPSGTGELIVKARMPVDLAGKQREIQSYISQYDQLAVTRKEARSLYVQLLALITLFILFVASWLALFLARQISVPITALLQGAAEVRKGNFAHRVQVDAIDELATLVRAFNEMTQAVAVSRGELEERRRFIEAILESIPTGVISVASDGRIQTVNGAMRQIFPGVAVDRVSRLEDLLPDRKSVV